IPAKAYDTDWVYILGQASIVLVAPIVVFLYLPFFRRLRVKTAYEYLERRFSLPVRLFGSLSFILLQLGRMAIVILLPAPALAAAAGVYLFVAGLVMGLVLTLVTTAGGIEVVVRADVVQVGGVVGGVLRGVVVISSTMDSGFGELISAAAQNGKFFTFTWS